MYKKLVNPGELKAENRLEIAKENIKMLLEQKVSFL